LKFDYAGALFFSPTPSVSSPSASDDNTKDGETSLKKSPCDDDERDDSDKEDDEEHDDDDDNDGEDGEDDCDNDGDAVTEFQVKAATQGLIDLS